MKRISIIAVCVFCFTAGSSFGQGGTLNYNSLESDSLKALKYGLWGGIDGSYFDGKLEMPDVNQHSIPDSLLKFYENDLNVLPFNRKPESNYWWKGDNMPGYPVPESPLPRYYDRGVPYYDRMPNQPNHRRSVPVPGFHGWKAQEIMIKSERS
jgi:hypothetical protein